MTGRAAGPDGDPMATPAEDGELEALLDYVHEHGFDLIVCGHHHHRRAGRLLLKGISRDLLEGSPVPVLIVSDEAL